MFPRVLCSPGYGVPQGTVFPRVLCSPGVLCPQGTVFPGVLCSQGTVFPGVLCPQGTVFPRDCVPQGTVLAPLMFLLYINGIGENVTSHIKLFADDCLLFMTIDSVDDTIAIQNDLCKMSLMAWKWQMIFNPEKMLYTPNVESQKSTTYWTM